MLIVSYDIENDKLRTMFAKFLKKFGHRIQYSVFEIQNSERILNIVISKINNYYSKKFKETDSVIIFKLSTQCEIIRFGYAQNFGKDLIVL